MLLKARSKLEIIDAAFQIYRSRFSTLFSAYIVAGVPATILNLTYLKGGQMGPYGFGIGDALILTALMVITLGLYIYASAISIFTASDTYKEGTQREIGELFRTVDSYRVQLIRGSVFKGIVVGIGAIFLLIPGLIMYVWYFAIPAVIILENLSSKEAGPRSRQLVKGHAWSVFWTYAIAGIGVFIAYGIILAILSALVSNPGVQVIFSGIVGALIAPIFDVITTVIYYDLRIKKEGLDLEVATGGISGADDGFAPAT